MATAATENENPITAKAKVAADPTAMPKVSDSLKAVTDTIASNTARVTANIKAMEENKEKTAASVNAIQKNIATVTSSLQTVQKVKDIADMEAQNTTIEAYDEAGGSDNQIALIKQLADQQAQSRQYLNELDSQMQEEHTGIYIIDSIINDFSTAQLRSQLNFSEQKEANLQADISNISNATESINKAQLVTRKIVNEGTIQAEWTRLAAEGSIRASEAEIAGMHSNSQVMASVMAADNNLLSNKLSLYRTEGEAEDRVLAQERAAFNREQMAFAKEKWPTEKATSETNLEASQLRLEVAKATKPSDIPAAIANNNAAVKRYNDTLATEETLVNSVQAAQSLAGMAVEDKETILYGLQQPNGSAAGTKYSTLLDIGSNPTGTLGNTPFEAIQNLNTISPSGNLKPTPITSVLKDVIKLQGEAFKADPNTVPKTEEALAADFNNRAKAYMEAKAGDIRTGDSSNPYQAPPMAVLKDIPAVANSPLYKKVLEAMQMQETNPQKIMDSAIAGVMAKTITPEQAADGVVTIFESAGVYNNENMGGFKRFGLPAQTSYKTTLTRDPSAFDTLRQKSGLVLPTLSFAARSLISNESAVKNLVKGYAGSDDFLDFNIDLMNRTKVQQAIVKMLSSQKPTVQAATPANK